MGATFITFDEKMAANAVDQRLSDLSAPWRLQPDEWRSGCSGGFKMGVRGADGKMQIGTFKGAA